MSATTRRSVPSLRGRFLAVVVVLGMLTATIGSIYVSQDRAGQWRRLGLHAVILESLLLIVLLVRAMVPVEREYAALVEQQERLDAAFHYTQRLETLGLLAGGVAHDINNVLTAISCSASLLLMDRDLTDPVRKEAEEITRSTSWALTLTRQLLDLGRKNPHSPQVLDLNVLVSELEHLLWRLLGNGVRLITRLASAPCLVYADVTQLQQVILNLATNAKHAMPDGGNLVIETHVLASEPARSALAPAEMPPLRLAPASRWVALTVTDTGCGMDADVAAHVFEPFFTTKEPGKGTGLGLSTVYRIVKQSGGEVCVSSEPGRGTQFTIVLPQYC